MSDERWKRIDRLLQAALGHQPGEREAFIRAECADDAAMRDEVLSLLVHDDSADKFLEPPPTRAPLQSGAKLGAYEIRGQIGQGGMGEVYRAHDNRLRRDIALKILPPEAADAERRQRFAREAQAVAALNHPGIVTIHSVEQSGDIHFLTMELVDGQTLDVLIPRGGLPIDRLLALAIPLAEAVGAAHGQGIVHRDLKPSNVMVTRDGRVKVMDFGLAKLTRRATLQDAGDASLTTMAQLTEHGRIFGTVAYMSPEQAEGRDVDHRSDVFSLGVVLFELATGQRPFTGESQVAVLASIVKDTPPPVTDLNPGLPKGLSRLVRKCLAKDPARRYQSVLDVRNDLEEIQADLTSPDRPSSVEPAEARSSVWRRAALPLFALIAVVGIAYVAWPRGADAPLVSESPLLTVPVPSGAEVAGQETVPRLAISPDGKWVAYHVDSPQDRRGLYLYSIGNIEPRLIRKGEVNGSPFFSPDSRWLGFWSERALWRVPVDVGEPKQITRVADQIRGASWGDDGNIVFALTANPTERSSNRRGGMLYRVRADGGDVTPITVPGAGSWFYFPHVLPGSRAALVMLLPDDRTVAPDRTVAVVSLLDGAIIHRLFRGSTPRYVRGGWLVFRQTGTLDSQAELLYVAPFDLDRLEATGAPRALNDRVIYNAGGSETSAFDVAAESGALVYVPPRPRDAHAELVWVDPEGQHTRILPEQLDYANPTLDPQGRRVAVQVLNGEQGSLRVYDLRSMSRTSLAAGLNVRGPMAWSSDGAWIVFAALSPQGTPSLYRVPATGGEATALASTAEGSVYDRAPSVVHDDVLFERQLGGTMALFKASLEPPWRPVSFLNGPFLARNPRIHPDRLYVAYHSDEDPSSGIQVWLRSYRTPDRYQTRVSPGTNLGTNLGWSRDGRTLYYRQERVIWKVGVVPQSGESAPQLGQHKQVLDLNRTDSGFVYEFIRVVADAPPHGERFLAVKRPQPPEYRLLYRQNWIETVAREIRKGR